MADTTTRNTAPADRKILLMRLGGAAALLVVTGLLEIFAQSWPGFLRGGIEAGAGTLIGKWLGVPAKEIIALALRSLAEKQPDQAVALTVGALQSLPPATAEAATARLFASLPPSARSRASLAPDPATGPWDTAVPLIRFVNDGPTTPSDLPPAAAPANTNATAAPSPHPRGGTDYDDDAATLPTRPSRTR